MATTKDRMEACANQAERMTFAAHGIRGAVSMLGGIREDLWTCPEESVQTFDVALQRLLSLADACSSMSVQGADS